MSRKWVKKFRILCPDHNLPQVARLIGTSLSELKRDLKNGHMPNAYKAVRMARALNVRVEDVFDEGRDDLPRALYLIAPDVDQPRFQAAVLRCLADILARGAAEAQAIIQQAPAKDKTANHQSG